MGQNDSLPPNRYCDRIPEHRNSFRYSTPRKTLISTIYKKSGHFGRDWECSSNKSRKVIMPNNRKQTISPNRQSLSENCSFCGWCERAAHAENECTAKKKWQKRQQNASRQEN